MKRLFYVLCLLSTLVQSQAAQAEDDMLSLLAGGGQVWTCSFYKAGDPNNPAPMPVVPIPSDVIDACTKNAKDSYDKCRAACPLLGRRACADKCWDDANTGRLNCIRDYCQNLIPGGDPSLVSAILMVYRGNPL